MAEGIAVYLKGPAGVASALGPLGQVITSAWEYDDTIFNVLDVDDTAYNFYPPRGNRQFVITGIYAVADKQVSASASASVVIYEATSITDTVASRVLLQTAMVQDQVQLFAPLNILVNRGTFVNAKTTDDDVHMTITGYYIPAVDRSDIKG